MSKLTDLATEDLAGWWLVDALDGRRWIGRIVGSGPGAPGDNLTSDGDPPLLEDEIVLSPAFEVPPDRALAGLPSMTTQLNPKTMQMEQVPAIQTVALALQQVALVFNVDKNGLQHHRIRRCSLARLDAWSPQARKNIRQGILSAIKLMEPDKKDGVSLIEASGR